MAEDPVEEIWQEVLASFDDEAVHKKFLTLCAGLDRLGEAGARYRPITADEDDPRREMAKRQVDRLIGLAMQNLDAIKTPPTKKGNLKTIIFLVALGVSGALVAHSLWSMLRAM
ncbi:MAG: hypothetical protein H6719_34880 [Sandaracinaceae bacterium]|nr:hypothetical protein [Sandaracinaceae bacterium]